MADLGKKPSWGRTLAIQAALCLALYAAFNIGRPHAPRDARLQSMLRRESLDLYFLSVRGGLRSPREQAYLLHKVGLTSSGLLARPFALLPLPGFDRI